MILDDLIYIRTQADVDDGTAIGHYNYTDLNRVGEAVNYIRDMFLEYGYAVPDALRTDWAENDLPQYTDMQNYIRSIRSLCSLVVFMQNPPALPFSMAKLGFASANNIEEALFHLGQIAENIPATWFECGQIESGVAYTT